MTNHGFRSPTRPRRIPMRRHLWMMRSIDLNPEGLNSVEALQQMPTAQQVADAIRSGVCPSDRFFDQFLPYDLREASGRFWTPLSVALKVADWLSHYGVRHVVDIGSGAGKFCIAAALASRCRFTGLEQRSRLVQESHRLAQVFGIEERVHFLHSTLDQIPEADAYYLYNPFGENLCAPHESLDQDVELSPERYERDISFMEEFFAQAPPGTLVVKFNGFGGRMPASYEEILVDPDVPSALRMWRKRDIA